MNVIFCESLGLCFFFKQKTSYEMLISAGSSGVCSSELPAMQTRIARRYAAERRFKALGLGAILLSGAFLAFLLFVMVGGGRAALPIPMSRCRSISRPPR